MYVCMYIYIYIYTYYAHNIYNIYATSAWGFRASDERAEEYTRSPYKYFRLEDFRQGLGCSEIHLFIGSGVTFSRGWVRKDGNLLTETGCRQIDVDSMCMRTCS